MEDHEQRWRSFGGTVETKGSGKRVDRTWITPEGMVACSNNRHTSAPSKCSLQLQAGSSALGNRPLQYSRVLRDSIQQVG